MDDVGFEAAVDDLALDDIAWLCLLAQDRDCVVSCNECVEGIDLVRSVTACGETSRVAISYPFPRTGSSMCLFTKVLDFHANVRRRPY